MNVSEFQQVLIVERDTERFRFCYSVYLYVMLVLSLGPTVIFSILLRDRFRCLNPEFRPFMIHGIGASSTLMITFSIWQPIALPPLFGGYSVGLLSLVGVDGFLTGLWLTWTCMSHLGMTFALAFVLQSYQLKVS